MAEKIEEVEVVETSAPATEEKEDKVVVADKKISNTNLVGDF